MSSVKIKDNSREVRHTVMVTTEAKFDDFMQSFVEVSRAEAPIITGQLRESISSGKSGPMQRTIFTQTGYGGFVHEGTSRMGGNPFFNRALDRIRPEFNNSGPWIK